MNIKNDIQSALDRTGWTASKLAQEAQVPIPVITRVLSGKRKGVHSSTLEKLAPFLYPPQSPTPPLDAA